MKLVDLHRMGSDGMKQNNSGYVHRCMKPFGKQVLCWTNAAGGFLSSLKVGSFSQTTAKPVFSLSLTFVFHDDRFQFNEVQAMNTL